MIRSRSLKLVVIRTESDFDKLAENELCKSHSQHRGHKLAGIGPE